MPLPDQRTVKIKTGVVIVLAVAIFVSMIFTVVRVVGALGSNAGASGGGSNTAMGITVDNGLFDVKLTFPASVLEVMYDGEAPEAFVQRMQLQEGVKKAEVDAVGYINMQVSKEYYQTMLDEMYNGITQMLNDYVQSGNYFSFQKVEFNGLLTEFKIYVGRTAFENSSDNSVSTPIGTRAVYYRIFMGDNPPQVKVIFLDFETQEIVREDVYPQS